MSLTLKRHVNITNGWGNFKMMLSGSRWTVLAFFLLAGLQGCASKSVPLSQDDFTALMEKSGVKVDSYVDGGKLDDAVGLLDKMAEENPARKEPWVKLAKVYFESGDYGNAIVAADEALHRDSTDQTAKGIRAVSGLRVATQSLTELRDDANLKGSAHADALSLAKALRETLGEEILVPVTGAENKNGEGEGAVAVNARRRVHVHTTRAPKVIRPSPAPVAQPAVNGDPFSVLR
jgi:tetratricopeptide (TPR) repeat protein